ncbi:uncharacterized protein METZ01_LOCUS357048 [marine metagenome]|uniref:Uncharacterized protein n=1 Tax=marine metagenome TaxID=408172 RepID=A0A382S2M9_9ZZZZ
MSRYLGSNILSGNLDSGKSIVLRGNIGAFSTSVMVSMNERGP